MSRKLKTLLLILGILLFLIANGAISYYFYEKNKRLEEKLLTVPESGFIEYGNQTYCNPYEMETEFSVLSQPKGVLADFFSWLSKHWNSKFVLKSLSISPVKKGYQVTMSIKLSGSLFSIQQQSDRFVIAMGQKADITSSNLTFYSENGTRYGVLNLELLLRNGSSS